MALILLLAGTAPASAAFLGANSPPGESFLNTGIEKVAGDVSQEVPPGSGGSWLERAAECFVAPRELNLSETVANHATDVITKGPCKGELARPFVNSPLTMQEIMAAGKPVPDAIVPGALKWNVPGAFRGSAGTWELVVGPRKRGHP